jgi:hypothetical protein
MKRKNRITDVGRGESFGFLGFDFRRVRSLRGVWHAHYTQMLKKLTRLQRKLKDVFRRHQSQPIDRVVRLINAVLCGRAFQCVLRLHQRLGGKGSFGAICHAPGTKGLRLVAVA